MRDWKTLRDRAIWTTFWWFGYRPRPRGRRPNAKMIPRLTTRTTGPRLARCSKKASYSETNDMIIEAKFAGREVGYDVPAIPGMFEDEIQTRRA